jgi:hypothetical protein
MVIGMEYSVSIAHQGESVVKDSVGNTRVVPAGIHVVKAPGVVVVNEFVGSAVVNVVQEQVPGSIGAVLDVLAFESPNAAFCMVDLMENISDGFILDIHPVSKALVIENSFSLVMVDSLNKTVEDGVLELFDKGMVVHHASLISVWAITGGSLPEMVKWTVAMGSSSSKNSSSECKLHIK